MLEWGCWIWIFFYIIHLNMLCVLIYLFFFWLVDLWYYGKSLIDHCDLQLLSFSQKRILFKVIDEQAPVQVLIRLRKFFHNWNNFIWECGLIYLVENFCTESRGRSLLTRQIVKLIWLVSVLICYQIFFAARLEISIIETD